MTGWLDTLSERARLLAATLIVALFGLVLIAPVFIGAGALLSALDMRGDATTAERAIEDRLAEFQARRDQLRADHGMSEAQLERYLDGEATRSELATSMAALADALQSRGVSVSGADAILERQMPDGVTLLTVDVSVRGRLSDILTTTSAPEFTGLRTQTASFAAISDDGEVRGAFRFSARHGDLSGEDGNAR